MRIQDRPFHHSALLDRARSDVLTRFTNWTIHPAITGEARKTNPVRTVRNFANSSLRMWLYHASGTSYGRLKMIGPRGYPEAPEGMVSR